MENPSDSERQQPARWSDTFITVTVTRYRMVDTDAEIQAQRKKLPVSRVRKDILKVNSNFIPLYSTKIFMRMFDLKGNRCMCNCCDRG